MKSGRRNEFQRKKYEGERVPIAEKIMPGKGFEQSAKGIAHD